MKIETPSIVIDQQRRRGRPRNASTDSRILAATQRLLIEGGYGRLSLDAVAEAAGVARPTIYRRHKSKVELVAAALTTLPEIARDIPGGSARSQVTWVLQQFLDFEQQIDPWTLLGTVLSEERRHPDWLEHVRRRLMVPRRVLLREILERGIGRDEVRRDLDLETAVDLITGPLFTRRVAVGRFPPEWPGALIDTLWPVFEPPKS